MVRSFHAFSGYLSSQHFDVFTNQEAPQTPSRSFVGSTPYHPLSHQHKLWFHWKGLVMNSKRHSYHLGKSLSCQEPGTNTKYSSPPSPHLLFEVEHSYDTFHKLKWCKGKKQLPFIYLYGKNFVQVLNFGPGDTQCFILFTTIEILNYVQFYPKPNNHMSFFRFL